jgi:hypothetical protein
VERLHGEGARGEFRGGLGVRQSEYEDLHGPTIGEC